MSRPHAVILKEIVELTGFLIEKGFVDDQNFPHLESAGRHHSIPCPNASFASLLKDVPYSEAYLDQRTRRAFNCQMLDGALVQMSYEFNGTTLMRARLAFLPSPDLLEFQNNADLYLEELLYADVVDKRVVTVPLRFDFDARPGVSSVLSHPVSHLTLGQYQSCRIPAVGALTPSLFMSFIVRSFYGLATSEVGAPPTAEFRFPETILPQERDVVHIGVPCSA